MSDREDWLELTREPAREPDVPVCDAHHHLWSYPGNRYLTAEFLHDLSGGHRVVSSVFIECQQFYRSDGPKALRAVGETEYVHQLANEASGGPTEVAAGIIAFADLSLGAAVVEVLEAHCAASDRLRGIRHATAWHPSEQVHNSHTRPTEGLMADPRFRRGFACMEPLGLSFDAWLYHTQLPELVDLARAFPGVTIVLDHMAGPLGIGPFAGRREQVFEGWQAQLAPLADCENVHVKLGGRTMTNAGFGWHKRETPPASDELAHAMAPYFHTCIDLFGPRRCLFESNFPMDRVSCSYTVLWNAFKHICAQYSSEERAALLHDNAVGLYRLNT